MTRLFGFPLVFSARQWEGVQCRDTLGPAALMEDSKDEYNLQSAKLGVATH